MNEQAQKPGEFSVAVRNLMGAKWTEKWDKTKLAYYILMSDLQPPKFQTSLRTEWVPLDENLYQWDKNILSKDEFETLATQWPGLRPVPFKTRECEWFHFLCKSVSGFAAVGSDPSREPLLFNALVTLCSGRLQYERFDYVSGRDVFFLALDDNNTAELLKTGPELRNALRRMKGGLFRALKERAPQRREVRFICRHGSFEPPFQIWHEL